MSAINFENYSPRKEIELLAANFYLGGKIENIPEFSANYLLRHRKNASKNYEYYLSFYRKFSF